MMHRVTEVKMNKSITFAPLILVFVFQLFCFEEVNSQELTLDELKDDLQYLNDFLQKHSSYQGFNGFSYQEVFDDYVQNLDSNIVSINELGVFLTETIGKIGDRHANVRGYDLPNSKFLPFIVAPLENKVIALSYDKTTRNYETLYPDFPYLTSINTIDIHEFLKIIEPEEIKAPRAAFFTSSVKQLKYIEENYARIHKVLPEINEFTFSDGKKNDTIISLPLESERRKYTTWDEKFFWKHVSFRRAEDFNDKEVAQELFTIDSDTIAVIRVPRMISEDDAPIFYKELNLFMDKTKSTKAMIVDIRSNGGGTRGLIWELAGYFIHPDSLYVVNVAQQRGDLPLNKDLKKDLNNRYLYAMDQLNKKEQEVAKRFAKSFKPIYKLPKDKFSEYHYAIFNGEKLLKEKYHYNKPVYILINERSFSAASVFAAAFKGLPNIKLVGVKTDGSSGNSERFELPYSKLRIKISTMVSFQKDGKVLDGLGTAPDIEIKRNIDQIFWKQDYQLDRLKEIIKNTK